MLSPKFGLRLGAATLALVGIARANPEAAGSESSAPAATFAAPADLRATLIDPLNVVLEWKDRATHARGYFVEYRMYRDEEFVILGTVPPHAPRFRHENLAPETRFTYRVRPFFGCTSPAATIKTGKTSSVVATEPDWAAPQREPAPMIALRKSIRSTTTATDAAPAALVATLVRDTGVKLTWRDRADDEDGYIVEIKLATDPEYRVCALLEPDTISFGLTGLPAETECAFRVRAFFYGEPSNLAEQKTGASGPAPSKS